jgi:hypothetical protein
MSRTVIIHADVIACMDDGGTKLPMARLPLKMG